MSDLSNRMISLEIKNFMPVLVGNKNCLFVSIKPDIDNTKKISIRIKSKYILFSGDVFSKNIVNDSCFFLIEFVSKEAGNLVSSISVEVEDNNDVRYLFEGKTALLSIDNNWDEKLLSVYLQGYEGVDLNISSKNSIIDANDLGSVRKINIDSSSSITELKGFKRDESGVSWNVDMDYISRFFNDKKINITNCDQKSIKIHRERISELYDEDLVKFKDEVSVPELTLIPSGCLYIDSGKVIRIDKPFYLSVFTVTNKELSFFYKTKSDDDLPVVDINWAAAKKYVDWLSHKLGRTFRLPSYDEWEYAARLGSNGYALEEKHYANFLNDKTMNEKKMFSRKVFETNVWGLISMYGNVWEWVEDDYDMSGKLIAGGSYNEKITRLDIKEYETKYKGFKDVGFRVLMEI